MYKRQKRRRYKRGKKQRGGVFPFSLLYGVPKALRTIDKFSRQKGAINKAKFAYNKLSKGKGSLIKVY